MSHSTIDPAFSCVGCEYGTIELREGVSHAVATGHSLTRTIDDEGTVATISLGYDGEDGLGESEEWGDDEW